MILDCKVLEGNPADSTLAKTMADRQVEIFSRPPRQIVFDGSFASKVNLSEIKRLYPEATQRLLTATRDGLPATVPAGIVAQPAYEWFLTDPA